MVFVVILAWNFLYIIMYLYYTTGMELTEVQKAYLAALIDGEGHVGCQRQMQKRGRTPLFKLCLAFTMSTPEPLETVSSWIGMTPTWHPPVDEKRQARVRLSTPKELTCAILNECMPYLILKKDVARIALEIESVRAMYSPDRQHWGTAKLERMPMHAVDKMEDLYRQLRATMSNKRPIRCRIATSPLNYRREP